MWWEPQSDDERRIAKMLPRLERNYLDRRREALVLGVGSFFASKPMRLLLLLNQRSMDKPPEDILIVTDGNRLPPQVVEQLQKWELPTDTVYAFVTLPEPVSTQLNSRIHVGAAIRCQATHTRTTIGVGVARTADPTQAIGFLTAGHLAPNGMGSTVELIHTSWLVFTQYYAIGRVVECVTPTAASTTAEYDAAIVELYNPNLFSNLPHRGVAHIRSPQPQPLLSTLFGGVSGAVGPAAIVGSLTAYGGPAGIWKNSWLVQPSGMISQGDSGGVLLRDADQTVVGMIVGGSRVPNSTRYMAQYAHDMESLASDVLKPRGYQIA